MSKCNECPKPPFDHENLDNRIAALEIMTRLIIDSLSAPDISALSFHASVELDRIKESINPDRYLDIAQFIHSYYLQKILPERFPNMED